MSWIKHPLTLEDDLVMLVPLEEKHFQELINVSQDEIIWTFLPLNGTDKEKLKAALYEALVLRDSGEQYPFVVIEKATNKIIGSTRLLRLNEVHKSTEIGWTWYVPQYWSKGYNEACKLLLLTYCFETLKTIRVQIITSEKNLRSQNAIRRIGGTYEGILRNFVMREGGPRNTAFFSIIDSEWELVKKNLTDLLNDKKRLLLK